MMRATLKVGPAGSLGRPGARWLAGRWAPLVALAVLGALGIAPSRAHAQANSATLSITRPSSGPVGAHIVGSAKSFSAGHTYSLGYTTPALGACTVNFTAIPDAATFTVKSDGTATFTFIWPATDTGIYSICARDTNDNPLSTSQSTNHFEVLGTTPPAIQVAPAPGANGTPPASDGTYYPGSQVQVTGTDFLPGGTTVGIFYSGVQSELGTLLTTGINADTNGGFTATVKLPDFRTGTLYLHAATLDSSSSGLPPSLEADAQITVSPQPTATPTATATAVVSPTSASNGNTGNPGNSAEGDGPRVAGIVGLSSLSVLLLALGAYFLITGTRARRLI
jgi:hypothetical protein